MGVCGKFAKKLKLTVFMLCFVLVVSSTWAFIFVSFYEEGSEGVRASVTNISAADARSIHSAGCDVVFLDVREVSEYNAGHISGAINMPWNSGVLQANHTSLPDKPTIVYCKSGGRSASASSFLVTNSHTDIYNMLGGYTAWAGLPAATPTPMPVVDTTFEIDEEGWSFHGVVNPFDCPESEYSTDSLCLSPNGSSNCFSFWESPAIPIEDGILYSTRWSVGNSVIDPDDSVQFRLRLNQMDSWQMWSRIVNSFKSQSPCAGCNKDYVLYFSPSVGTLEEGYVKCAFDLLSFERLDDCFCRLCLDALTVTRVGRITGEQVVEYDFAAGTEGWQFVGQAGAFDEPGTSDIDGRLGLTPFGSTNCFSYWESPDIDIKDGRVYRARYTVASDVTDANDAVQFRLRFNQKGSWQAWERGINSVNQQAPSSAGAKVYDLFLNPSVTGEEDDVGVFSFDIMSFDANDDTNSWLYLDSFLLEKALIVP